MSKAHIQYIAAMLIFGFNGILASAIPWHSYEIVLSRTVIGSLFMLELDMAAAFLHGRMSMAIGPGCRTGRIKA